MRLQLVARCAEDILKARGVKPTLSPNLNTLATVEALQVKRLLFIGVGCQVLAAFWSLRPFASSGSMPAHHRTPCSPGCCRITAKLPCPCIRPWRIHEEPCANHIMRHCKTKQS